MLNNIVQFPLPFSEFKFNINEPGAMYDIANNLQEIMNEAAANTQQIVILCIGSDRSTGDALGPLTGTKLRSFNPYPYIYGTLDEPVHAKNLHNTLEQISTQFYNPYIIAVDACLGKVDSVGCISLGRGSLKPGAAVQKELPSVGNAYITGIVNVGGFMEHLVLQSTRLNLVMKMADTIAHSLSWGLRSINGR